MLSSRCRYAQHECLPLRGSDGVDQSYVTDPPKCPGCGGFTCPQFLFFDEQYESHDFYQWTKVTQWLDTADAFVFVGTSFAVGVTAEALHQAEKRAVPCFQFNVNIPAKLRSRPRLNVRHILGESVKTVPAFADAAIFLAATTAASRKEPDDSGSSGDPCDSKRRRTIGGSNASDDTTAIAAVDAAADANTANAAVAPSSFGALKLVPLPKKGNTGTSCIPAIESLIRKHAVHDWTYPLSVVQGCTPGHVYADKDVTIAVVTSRSGFYSVVGVPTPALLTDAVQLLTSVTGWDFLYTHPPAAWDYVGILICLFATLTG